MIAATPLPTPPTALLGRSAEITSLTAVVIGTGMRLLTITGPPGVGKTHLAISVAVAAGARFAGGTAWVDLSLIDDDRLVLPEIARSLGITGLAAESLSDRITSSLADRDVLVLVDNCEHVLGAASQIGVLLAANPRLRMIATSRERLRISAEREFALPPLAMPSERDVSDLARLAVSPAVALLLDRSPDHIKLTPRTARALADICIRLDGLPLATELAAARLRVFTPSELAFRLEHRMAVLTGDSRDSPKRHRDLRAAIVWSHELLPEPERLVFRRLSVFAGDWTVDAARAVCGEPKGGVTNPIGSLLDKSLIRRVPEDDGEARFGLLASLREFAAQQLVLNGEVIDTRARHAAFFADSARGWVAALGTEEETATWPRLGLVRADLLAAYTFSRSGSKVDETLWLAAGLGWYWYTRGSLADAAALIDFVAAAEATLSQDPLSQDPLSQDALGAALLATGVVAFGLGRLETADELLSRSASLAGGEPRRLAFVAAFRGHVARGQGRRDDARREYEAARALYQSVGSVRGVAWLAHDLGLLASELGELREARSLLHEAVATFRVLDYDWALAVSACRLASVLLREGSAEGIEESTYLLREALLLQDTVGDRRGVAQCLEGLAQVAYARGDAAAGARLLGAAAGQRARAAAQLTEGEQTTIDRLDGELSRSLGRIAADHEQHAGRTMPVAAAIALAIRVAGTEGVTGPPDPSPGPLTPRQRQVAARIAAGDTNRQLARALGISEKTAEIHLRNIMDRLEVPSRASIAAWASTHGLGPPE
ncbi:MAG: LuxR family transcriptional regulator [Pseudonocardiales bacterium]|nr:LuxR family transcriptional regulator [Pseudonocardiales bacterium]